MMHRINCPLLQDLRLSGCHFETNDWKTFLTSLCSLTSLHFRSLYLSEPISLEEFFSLFTIMKLEKLDFQINHGWCSNLAFSAYCSRLSGFKWKHLSIIGDSLPFEIAVYVMQRSLELERFQCAHFSTFEEKARDLISIMMQKCKSSSLLEIEFSFSEQLKLSSTPQSETERLLEGFPHLQSCHFSDGLFPSRDINLDPYIAISKTRTRSIGCVQHFSKNRSSI
jgi:hypothetical protein